MADTKRIVSSMERAPSALPLVLMQESTRDIVQMDVEVNDCVQNAKCKQSWKKAAYAPYVNQLQRDALAYVRLKWRTGFKSGLQKGSSQCTAAGTDETRLQIHSNVAPIVLISFLNWSPWCYWWNTMKKCIHDTPKDASLRGKQRPLWGMATFPFIGSASIQMRSKSMDKHVELERKSVRTCF